MHEVLIKIPDQAYAVASRIAQQEGFASPEVFLSEFVSMNISEDPDNYDHLFTQEVIAELDAACAEARTGNNLTLEQVSEHFRHKREEWLKNHPA